ncbi:J domain-containing protein [Plasmodiophora brassicae]|uniref:J domain-containing protein n=1 Tax=Plasmodiophora brassicae TaxID=37360 RepID=A0A0G4J3Z5_PLABS|nr:hypothetical protein PBRA_002266 [Plasmodiophora brassicae]SPQ98858.1 unnamed protein product [Plasmodiophora brassicae]
MRLLPIIIAIVLVGTLEARRRPPTYYQLLNVSQTATAAEIKAAYRTLAFKLHPDRNSDAHAAKRFIRVKDAYEKLSSVNHRAAYDLFLKMHNGYHHDEWDKNGSFSQWQNLMNMMDIADYHWMYQIVITLLAIGAGSCVCGAVITLFLPVFSFISSWLFWIMLGVSLYNSAGDWYKAK